MKREPSPPGHVDLSNEGVHWDLGTSQSYGDYLHLRELLSAQQPISFEHDDRVA